MRSQIKRVQEASFGLHGARKTLPQRRPGSIASSALVAPMPCGWSTSPTSKPGQGLGFAQCPRALRPPALYIAFVIDAYARRIMGGAAEGSGDTKHRWNGCGGWKVGTSATAGFALDALEKATHTRRPGPDDGLIHHSDRGVQYLAMNYTQRLAEANLVPSVGSVGDSYDNALAETINGPYKAEVIWRQQSWPRASAVEMATLRWVDWFNNHRLFGLIGHIPPAEAETNYYAAHEIIDRVARPN